MSGELIAQHCNRPENMLADRLWLCFWNVIQEALLSKQTEEFRYIATLLVRHCF